MLDVLVDRRKLLGMVQDFSHIFGRQYKAQQQTNDIRQDGQQLIENSMKIWSTKLSNKELSAMDPKQRKENAYKLQQMIKELEIKQKQLLRLIQNKDSTDAKRNLVEKKYNVQGRMSESIDMLVLFIKEAKEDS